MGAGRPGTTSPYKKKRSGSLPVRNGLWWTSAALLKSGKNPAGRRKGLSVWNGGAWGGVMVSTSRFH